MSYVTDQIAILEALERCERGDIEGARDGTAPLSILSELTGIPIAVVEQRVHELVVLDDLLEQPGGYYGRNVLIS